MVTKFRAFQLGSAGSLFSYYKQNSYYLIEARIPKAGVKVLEDDLKLHGKTKIDILHITSWDTDHCCYTDLTQILNKFRPSVIEVPSYEPESDEAKLCKDTLEKYDVIHEKYKPNIRKISREYISGLPNATSFNSNNVIYPSAYNSDCKNDMSLIKLFRSNGFNILSLGDCESQHIAQRLMSDSILQSEVDVLVLPHHGADNGFMSEEFLDKIKPKIAVCSSNYDNQYDHPRQEVRDMLRAKNIPLMTTKRGDVIISQFSVNFLAVAESLRSDNTVVERTEEFLTKKAFREYLEKVTTQSK